MSGFGWQGPRILFAVTEVSGVGGSATAAYDLFRRLRCDGEDVHFLNLVDQDDAGYVQFVLGDAAGNPAGLPSVHRCLLTGPRNAPHPELTRTLETLDCDVAVAFGFMATTLVKRARPSLPTMFVTGSSRNAQDHVVSGRVKDAVSLAAGLDDRSIVPRILNRFEAQAVDLCDLVLTHSRMTYDMFRWFLPTRIGKVHPEVCSFAEWICDGAREWLASSRPFDERDIDVLFVASDWGRVEKNYPLVRRVARALRDLRLHVVGDVPTDLPGVVHHRFITSRDRLFDLYGRARAVACPSLIDAAPGALYEAAVMGCNVVASRNCGNWRLCHPDLLVEGLQRDAWGAAIRRAVARRYADRLDEMRDDSYEWFRQILAALAEPVASPAR
jgi:glycosyltransferase involved in cell wall biosynthesis